MPRSRGDVNFRSLFQDFNASKFVIFTSLLIFSLLYALKLDRVLNWSWWSIFIPIWIWKGIVGEFLKCYDILMSNEMKNYRYRCSMVNPIFYFLWNYSVWCYSWILRLVETPTKPSECRWVHTVQGYAYKVFKNALQRQLDLDFSFN